VQGLEIGNPLLDLAGFAADRSSIGAPITPTWAGFLSMAASLVSSAAAALAPSCCVTP
jgi:hypothetical protein